MNIFYFIVVVVFIGSILYVFADSFYSPLDEEESKDRLADRPCHIELHLTTERELSPSEIIKFEQMCLALDAKAIVIEIGKGSQTQQPMLTKKIKTNS